MMGSTALALLAWPTIEGYIAGQTAGIALAALAFGRLKRAAGPGRPDLEGRLRRDAWRQITSYGLPFAALGLLGWLSNLSERYVLAATLDAAAVGQYVAAFSIASRPPTMVAGLLTDILRPEMFEAENRREGARARRAYFAWLAVQASAVALTSLAFLAFGTEIAALLLAESYRHGAPAIMGWIAIGYGFLAMAQAVENRVLSRAASRRLVLPKLAGAGANLALAIVLIPKFGVTGAAQANAFGQLLYLAGTLLAARELTRD